MLIGRAQQDVIGIDELYEISLGHFKAYVARHSHSLILLADIHNVVSQRVEGGKRALIGAVVHHDNLALKLPQRQILDAVNARTQHLYRHVEHRDDEAD